MWGQLVRRIIFRVGRIRVAIRPPANKPSVTRREFILWIRAASSWWIVASHRNNLPITSQKNLSAVRAHSTAQTLGSYAALCKIKSGCCLTSQKINEELFKFMNGIVKILKTSLFWWLVILMPSTSMVVALYFQYALDVGPCALCVHARIYMAGLIIVGLIGALHKSTLLRAVEINNHPKSTLCRYANKPLL